LWLCPLVIHLLIAVFVETGLAPVISTLACTHILSIVTVVQSCFIVFSGLVTCVPFNFIHQSFMLE
jgi:hypothetical protein